MATDLFFQKHPARAGGVGKFCCPVKDISKGMAAGIDFEGFLAAFGDKDIQILRVSGNAINRAALAPEFADDHPHDGAVIVHNLGNVVCADILIARLGHL